MSSKNPRKLSERAAARQLERIKKLVGEHTITLDQVVAASKIPIPAEPHLQTQACLSTLFSPDDYVALRAGFKKPGETKELPIGPSIHIVASSVAEIFDGNPNPGFEKHGGFFTPNPTLGLKGSGKRGTITDDDIKEYRYAVIEHDDVPKETQLLLLSVLRLPIVSIVDTGNKSLHALVRIGAPSASAYDTLVPEMYEFLELLGFDRANKNASRMTRLPGIIRELPNGDEVLQRLVYLNPEADGTPIIDTL